MPTTSTTPATRRALARPLAIVAAATLGAAALVTAFITGCQGNASSVQQEHRAQASGGAAFSPTPAEYRYSRADMPNAQPVLRGLDMYATTPGTPGAGDGGSGHFGLPPAKPASPAAGGSSLYYIEAAAPERDGLLPMARELRAAQPRPSIAVIDVPRLSSSDELLVIIRREGDRPAPPTPPPSDDTPTFPCLMAHEPGTTTQVAVPLRHTDVKGSIAGPFSAVTVTQQFVNPYDGKIEAVYVFPLPENAAVNDFVMTIGDRHIRGVIREREQAEQIYSTAKSQGYTASLLTQERPNIFTQKVANIEPGRQVDIAISYYGPLTYIDGAFEFVFPMVVGPRYNPPAWKDGVAATPRGRPDQTRQPTEVQYLKPHERSSSDIGIALDIDAGVPIHSITSPSHAINTQTTGRTTANVALANMASLPNKDFVLRINVASDRVQSGVIAASTERGNFFSLLIVPPASLQNTPRGPVEMVFVLDASGSMNGRPIEQAKDAISRGLDRLEPGDTFQLINFAQSTTQLGSRPLYATRDNVERAKRYLDTIQGQGGTEMLNGLRTSLDFPHDAERLRYVVFATDGFIGNEPQVLAETDARLGWSRVFSLGIGSAPNRYLMDSMARMGRGFASYLSLDESPYRVMDAFMERVSHSALHDVAIDFGGARVSEVLPARIPDVYVGRPVTIIGRYEGALPNTVRISGRAGGSSVTIDAPVYNGCGPLAQKALGPLWARAKITALADRAAWDAQGELPVEIKRTALDWSLMSQFTAFVAVDSSALTSGLTGTTVAMPVPVPEGVQYRTTIGGGGADDGGR